MAYEVTRDMPTQLVEIETPLETMSAPMIEGRKTAFVVVMRAGAGLLEGMLDVVPGARVGHIGIYRDPKTLVAIEYYFKMPSEMSERDAIVLDPMLATGNTAVAAVDRLKETNPRSIRFVSLICRAGGHRQHGGAPPGRADLHGRDRSRAQRPRLHRAGPRRHRRPHLRHHVSALDGR